MSDPHPLKRSAPWLVVAVVFLIAIFCGLYLWYRTITLPEAALERAREIAAEFQRKLQFTPEIRVNARTITIQDTPVFQLVTMERNALVRYQWIHTWLHSTKNIEIAAIFTARAGFDLRKPFSIQLNASGQATEVSLPPAQILSLGFTDMQILTDTDGMWNKLTTEDRQQAFLGLEAEARRQFEASSLQAEAQREGEKRIRELLGPPQTTRISFEASREKK